MDYICNMVINRIKLFKALSFFILFTIVQASAQYAVNGNATQISCNCYRLTPDANGQSGSVWNLNQINLNNPFDFYFDVYLGCNDGGADGLAFVLQPVSTTIGSAGGGLGYAGIAPSIAVEIDTYQNSGDPSYDHIAIMRNGDVNHGSGNNLAGPVQASASSGNVEDCANHVLHVTWDPVTMTLQAFIDGNLRLTYTGDIISNPFGGNPNVYWGLTAATGGARNEHRFCVAINPNFSVVPANNCVDLPTQFSDNSYSPIGPISSWAWDFGDGNTSGQQNPLHTYTAPGTYNVTLTVADINGCTDFSTIPVTIFPNPVASAGTDAAICGGSSTTLNGSGGVSYLWEPPDGLSSQFISNPVASPLVTTTYTMTISDANGCQDTDDVTVSIGPTPAAAFSANNECLGTAVQFTDQSTVASGTITQWTWDFGDGATSLQQNPSHVYAAAGTYTVSLTATTADNCPGVITHQVTVFPLPVADFSFTAQCDGVGIPFNDLSTVASGAIAQWGWDFGDGSQDISQNPVHAFPADGSFTVSLGVVSDQGCPATTSQQVIVFPNPVADFTAPPECFGTAIDFTDASSVSSGTIDAWNWDFDDGNTASVQAPSNNYAAPGTYTVVLTVTTNNQCMATQSHDVNVNAIPVADFNFNNACEASPVSFTDASTIAAGAISSWQWDFGDLQQSVQQNPAHTYTAAGTYTVTLTVSSGTGCNHQAQQDVTVYPLPSAAFTNTTVCEGDATQFTDQSTVINSTVIDWIWDFGDGSTANEQNPLHTYLTYGSYNVSLTASTADGCTNTLTQLVTVYASPVPDFTAPDVCFNTTTVFTNTSTLAAGSISNTNWDFDDGITSTQNSPQHTFVVPNTYAVSLTIITGNGCTETVIKPVTVYPLPVVDFAAVPEAGCVPLDVQFTNLSSITTGSIDTWEWAIESAGVFGTQDASHTFVNAGLYDVSLKAVSDKGCETLLTQSDFITVHPKPVAEFTFTPQITEILYPEITFTDLSSGNPTVWNWDFGTGATDAVQNPVYSYPDTGIFTIKLEIVNQYGCNDTVSHTVIITPSFTIYVPTGFTPDGDGINDVFLPRGIGWRDYELRVFSRSGNEVFSSFDPDSGWDGKIRESQNVAIPGVYVWRIYVRDKNNRKQDFKGTVTLVR